MIVARIAIITAAVLIPAAPLWPQTSAPADDEIVYLPSDAELDQVIEEAIADEVDPGPSTSDDDLTDPPFIGTVPDLTSGAMSEAELDGLLGDSSQPLAARPGGLPWLFAGLRGSAAAATLANQDTLVDLSGPEARCDSFGADPLDPDRLLTPNGRIEGVPDELLELREIMASCGGPITRATAGDAQARRHAYIRARALLLLRRGPEAINQFGILCDTGYGMACYRLADYLSVARNGSPADPAAARRYAERAASLYVGAASALLDRLDAQDWVTRTELPGFHRAIMSGDFSTLPHMVSTQRMLITLHARLQARAQMWGEAVFSVSDEGNALKLRVPILAERVRAGWANMPPILADRARGPGLEAFIEGILRAGTEFFTFGRQAVAIEVAPAANDAKTMIAEFEARPESADRQTYTRNLARLMALWAQSDPKPDTIAVCRLFARDRQSRCLPLADANPAASPIR